MKYLFLRVLLVLLLLPELVFAQVRIIPELKLDYVAPALTAVPAGDDKIVALRQGEASPFSGQLMSSDTAIRWMNYLEQARFRLREDVILERRTCNANMAYYEQRISLEQSARKALDEDYQARVLRLEQKNADLQKELLEPGVFKSPIFWYVTGVVTTGVIVGISAFSLHQAQ